MKVFSVSACALFAALPTLVAAQDGLPDVPKPTREHVWLKKFAGDWVLKSKGVVSEGQPAVTSVGTMNSKMLGSFWLINRMEGKVAGMSFKGVQNIGYDVNKKKYVGTWIDNMNGHMWHYVGVVEKDGRKLVLSADGPNMQDPSKISKYRDAYEFKSNDEIIVTSSMQSPDGTWITFMSGTAKRKKPAKKKR